MLLFLNYKNKYKLYKKMIKEPMIGRSTKRSRSWMDG
jgi:hypothetical protein